MPDPLQPVVVTPAPQARLLRLVGKPEAERRKRRKTSLVSYQAEHPRDPFTEAVIPCLHMQVGNLRGCKSELSDLNKTCRVLLEHSHAAPSSDTRHDASPSRC